jgi:hypothetical protein
LCLELALFSIRTRFLQVRHIKEMFRLLFDGKSSESGVSSFQALSMSLAGEWVQVILQGSYGDCFLRTWSFILDVDGCFLGASTAS